jgi:hypothetical protein
MMMETKKIIKKIDHAIEAKTWIDCGIILLVLRKELSQSSENRVDNSTSPFIKEKGAPKVFSQSSPEDNRVVMSKWTEAQQSGQDALKDKKVK